MQNYRQQDHFDEHDHRMEAQYLEQKSSIDANRWVQQHGIIASPLLCSGGCRPRFGLAQTHVALPELDVATSPHKGLDADGIVGESDATVLDGVVDAAECVARTEDDRVEAQHQAQLRGGHHKVGHRDGGVHERAACDDETVSVGCDGRWTEAERSVDKEQQPKGDVRPDGGHYC